jgi:hypothetical protein
MAVHSVTRGIIEFTADGDVLLEVIKVNSLAAVGGDSGGAVNVFTNILKPTCNSGAWERGDPTLDRLLWSSGAVNANSLSESAVDIDWAAGIRVEMGAGMKLIVYGE